jgi:hypothetical protein
VDGSWNQSSLELLGKTGIKLSGNESPTGSETFVSERPLLRNNSGRDTEGTISRIFTGFIENSEPPATDLIDREARIYEKGLEDVQRNR